MGWGLFVDFKRLVIPVHCGLAKHGHFWTQRVFVHGLVGRVECLVGFHSFLERKLTVISRGGLVIEWQVWDDCRNDCASVSGGHTCPEVDKIALAY